MGYTSSRRSSLSGRYQRQSARSSFTVQGCSCWIGGSEPTLLANGTTSDHPRAYLLAHGLYDGRRGPRPLTRPHTPPALEQHRILGHLRDNVPRRLGPAVSGEWFSANRNGPGREHPWTRPGKERELEPRGTGGERESLGEQTLHPCASDSARNRAGYFHLQENNGQRLATGRRQAGDCDLAGDCDTDRARCWDGDAQASIVGANQRSAKTP